MGDQRKDAAEHRAADTLPRMTHRPLPQGAADETEGEVEAIAAETAGELAGGAEEQRCADLN